MEVVYEQMEVHQTIHEKMKEAIVQGLVEGKVVGKFLLNLEEWNEFAKHPFVPNILRSELPEDLKHRAGVGSVTIELGR